MRFLFLFLLLLIFKSYGQTPAETRLQGFEQRKKITENTPFSNLDATSMGPSVFSCRVTDVEADPSDPTRFYVAYASGGLWFTKSNGTTFEPVFDHEACMTIGDIAVDWQRNILWVGTGEANSSRSSYAGTGMYRSADGGKSWEYRGLGESHHIGRVVLHPDNPDVLWVAVLGHLYSTNPERGIFKSTDGGKTWQHTLFVKDNAGAVDLVMDPNDPNTLYAATWERERSAWNFTGAGEGSGIWKSSDSGITWNRISGGFPTGPNIGRIGLAAGRINGKTVLYASIDNQNPKPPKAETTDALSKTQLRDMTMEQFAQLDNDKLADFLKDNGFPEKYNTKKVKDLVSKKTITPLTLVDYLEDANTSLFETDFTGAEVYRSDNGGDSWLKTHDEPLERINFTYGYYFSNLRCDLNNADNVYLLGFLIVRSEDGGKNWISINGENVHVDHHALWLNPNKPGHLINGNDGGLNISWDNGASWILCNQPPVGQFYAIAADEADPYNVYGGAQDNGVWVGPSNYKPSVEWHQSGNYPYKMLLGGDGMQIAIDPRDNNTVYTGFQFGNYFRVNRTTGDMRKIGPKHDLGERPLRYNWQTPIHLSKHNPDILYLGANRLYRSMDKGSNWEAISADLTAGGRKGNVPFGTLTSIHESPLKFGLLYTGSDDGQVFVSRDGGETWRSISLGLPQGLWVSRVQASAHEKGRVYVSLNGYRNDNFEAFVYRSDDHGLNWTRLGADLPAEPVNVVREDPKNPDIVYLGTDHGMYVSIDRGEHFEGLAKDFPAVPVHDLVVQASASDLLVGTHGRSMYKVSVAQLQELTPEVLAKTVHVFEVSKRRVSRNWGMKQPWQELKAPEMPVVYYSQTAGKVRWTVSTKDGLELQSGAMEAKAGLNTFVYNLDVREDVLKKYEKSLEAAAKEKDKTPKPNKADTGNYYLQKGVYVLILEKDGVRSETEIVLE